MTATPKAPPADTVVPAPAAPRGLDSLMIAKASMAHVPYLRRLKELVMRDRYRPAADEAEFERWREVYCTDAYFEQAIADPDTMLLCIGTLRDPVGMVVLRQSGDELEIDDLLVSLPRQGDGTRLLVAALRYAEVWRSRIVHIDVYPGTGGNDLFLQTHGFRKVGQDQNDLGRPMDRYERRFEF